MRKTRLPAMAGLFLMAVALQHPRQAAAHDLWLERGEEATILYSGHKHSGHEGAERIEYDPGIVHGALCVRENGEKTSLEIPSSYPARFPGDCACIHVLTSSGHWTKTPYGTKNIPRDEAKQAISSWRSVESVKRIDRWSPKLAGPVSEDLELTPLSDPFSLKDGDKLRLLVTFGGKPLSAAPVAYDDKTRGETGTDGTINIRIRHGSCQIIKASFHEAVKTEKADETIHTATLVFELEEEE